MTQIRSSMILLGICVVALLIGVVRLATEKPALPVGSSYSSDPSGAQGLYEWMGAVGMSPSRLQEAVVSDDAPPASLLLLQPEAPIDSAARQAFEAVPAHAGTLIVAGDSLAWLVYARDLGLTVDPIRNGTTAIQSADGSLSLDGVLARYRLRGDGFEPLLVDANGDWIAASKPFKQGKLIVIATPDPLLNHSLRDADTARWVYRTVLASGTTVAIDESHHSFVPPDASAPMTFDRLMLTSAAGRAVLYACVVAFAFIVLTGRRLGPAQGGLGSTETHRTMYEHVQMLANLYRRAGQFGVLRDAFARHVARSDAPGKAARLARVESARSESELIAALRET